MVGLNGPYNFKFFKGSVPQILRSPFNALSQKTANEATDGLYLGVKLMVGVNLRGFIRPFESKYISISFIPNTFGNISTGLNLSSKDILFIPLSRKVEIIGSLDLII